MTADRAVQTILDNAASSCRSRASRSRSRRCVSCRRRSRTIRACRASSDAGARFDIIGASVETPDALLPPGEAYIRCYLQGYLWASKHVSQYRSADVRLAARQLRVLLVAADPLQRDGNRGRRTLAVPRVVDAGSAERQAGADLYDQKQIDFLWRAADGCRSSSTGCRTATTRGSLRLPS